MFNPIRNIIRMHKAGSSPMEIGSPVLGKAYGITVLDGTSDDSGNQSDYFR